MERCHMESVGLGEGLSLVSWIVSTSEPWIWDFASTDAERMCKLCGILSVGADDGDMMMEI
jgi:hypothetical protein